MTSVKNSDVRDGKVLVAVHVPAAPTTLASALRTTYGKDDLATRVLVWAACVRVDDGCSVPSLTFADAPAGLRVLELAMPVRTRSACDVQQNVPLRLAFLRQQRPARLLRHAIAHALNEGILVEHMVVVMNKLDLRSSAGSWPAFEREHVLRVQSEFADATFVHASVVELEERFGVTVAEQQARPVVTVPLPKSLAVATFSTLRAVNVRLGATVLVKRAHGAAGVPTVTCEQADAGAPCELLLAFAGVPDDAEVPEPDATLVALARVDAVLPQLTDARAVLHDLLQARNVAQPPHSHVLTAFKKPVFDRFTSMPAL